MGIGPCVPRFSFVGVCVEQPFLCSRGHSILHLSLAPSRFVGLLSVFPDWDVNVCVEKSQSSPVSSLSLHRCPD